MGCGDTGLSTFWKVDVALKSYHDRLGVDCAALEEAVFELYVWCAQQGSEEEEDC